MKEIYSKTDAHLPETRNSLMQTLCRLAAPPTHPGSTAARPPSPTRPGGHANELAEVILQPAWANSKVKR